MNIIMYKVIEIIQISGSNTNFDDQLSGMASLYGI